MRYLSSSLKRGTDERPARLNLPSLIQNRHFTAKSVVAVAQSSRPFISPSTLYCSRLGTNRTMRLAAFLYRAGQLQLVSSPLVSSQRRLVVLHQVTPRDSREMG
jgi:hypothetical protein